MNAYPSTPNLSQQAASTKVVPVEPWSAVWRPRAPAETGHY